MSDPVKDFIISEGRRIADHTWDTMWEERGGPYPIEQGDTSDLAYKAATERWAELQRQYLPANNATRMTTTEDIAAWQDAIYRTEVSLGVFCFAIGASLSLLFTHHFVQARVPHLGTHIGWLSSTLGVSLLYGVTWRREARRLKGLVANIRGRR